MKTMTKKQAVTKALTKAMAVHFDKLMPIGFGLSVDSHGRFDATKGDFSIWFSLFDTNDNTIVTSASSIFGDQTTIYVTYEDSEQFMQDVEKALAQCVEATKNPIIHHAQQ